jgi:acyl transferase domain-containing protein/NAD(P)-dependent dehydrogenase (short-subunit alcohol dehydrogenase family)/phosphopantetheinyl transferase
MSGAIRVLLPPGATHLVPAVLAAGGVPVVDATGATVPEVPAGAWVRTRPGRPAPGTGPVILAELGAAVPDRETWLETSVPRDVPASFAGLVLKGREAGGICGEEDGLVALARCPEPGRVLLDAGCGPRTAAAAAALGAAGVMLVEQHLGCPELALAPELARRLGLADDDVSRVVQGVRVAAAATAPVLRRLAQGIDDPWSLAAQVWRSGDPANHLWLVGQGLALARPLAERYGTLEALIRAYEDAFAGWASVARGAVRGSGRPVSTAAALSQPDTAAGVGGTVGSAVAWEFAHWLGRPVTQGPARAMLAVGVPVDLPEEELAAAIAALPPAPLAPAAPPPAELPTPTLVPTSRGATPAPAPVVAAPVPPVGESASRRGAAAVAIVGIGCRFPGGSDSAEAFWDNIVAGRYAIGEVPRDRWDPALYWDADESVPDKTYAKIGGFLTDFVFDPKPFRIPPNVARQVDPVQQITLVCVADALRDAGLQVDKKSPGRAFDRERCAVILGNSLGGEMTDKYAIRLAWPSVAQKLLQSPPFCDLNHDEQQRFLAQMEIAYKGGLPVVDEDSMPGELANVIAGRIANAFDLGGANFTVDAACASSMAAIQTAVKSLQDGESDLCITGGADRSMNIATYVKFCKIGALSPDHSAPFDASANGFVMGEGCGILVLKRYEDAVRDGDRVYAVIRGIGGSSDGKGKGITAPNLNGQVRALQRAWQAAGADPLTADLVEAHGTSTLVGDKVEVEALNAVLGAGRRGARGPVRLGSVKSMIGHLKSAAGAASVIKAALALHHGVFPPSANFRVARPDVPFDVIPLAVQTKPEPWPARDGIRRAGVSAFGFGGTNFHVVLEGYTGGPLPTSVAKGPPAPQPQAHAARPPAAAPTADAVAPRVELVPSPPPPQQGLPDGLWATSGRNEDELLENLRALRDGRAAPFHGSAPLRVAGAPVDADERKEQLDRAITGLEKRTNPDLLRARGIALEDVPFDRKLVFLFTGQGSQYLDMGLDLVERYPVVRDTFAEADRILTPALGKPITDFIRLRPGESEEQKDEVLRRTEYSQPATLTVDVAILRLLAAYGAVPDMVAGHSLGEYGAAVAAGILSFEQSLYAVSARGREMANIRIDDPGKMAGVATGPQVVEEVLADVDGYVIAANKNCPSQTVIAGASDAVDDACERFKAKGITVHLLPVSHAFHSAIVAPASEPLRGVLRKLGLKAPRRPITTNVTGDWYPTGPNAVETIIDLLAQQISAPVEWTAQMERMYDDDGRVFVEIGPKRALSGFTVAILKRRPHRSIYTNHPKRGGVASFRDALAQLLVLGVPLRAEPLPTDAIDLFAPTAPRLATSAAITSFREGQTSTQAPAAPAAAPAVEPAADLREGILGIVARATGYDVAELDLDYELEADLGIDTVKQAEVFSTVRDTFGIAQDPSFDPSQHRTLRSLVDWAAARTGARRVGVAEIAPKPAAAPAPPPPPAVAAPARPLVADDVVASFLARAAQAGVQGLDGRAFADALLPAVQSLILAAFDASRDLRPAAPPAAPAPPLPAAAPPSTARLAGNPWGGDLRRRVVASGAAIGLPGGREVFSDDNFESILSGDNRIRAIGERARKFLELGLVRLVKDPQTGQGSFLPVSRTDEVIRLAGTESRFDLSDWGIDAELQAALDVSTRLAFAAGLDALRDAKLPLVRTWKTMANGKRVPQGWQLPEALRDGTGVVFGSAFPGYDQLVRHLEAGGRDAQGRFDRRFLFQVLSMGHSQFAQLIGARGPNTAVNAACASSTQALAIAEDWIRLGRCERVIVVGADDVTSDALLPWIGGGFMAAGAASTHDVVEETALPFDRRRHGLVLGMGAVGVVLESADAAAARGIVPLAEQLAAVTVNSAFHGTRLDVEHIASVVKRVVGDVCAAEGITPAEMARSAFFMSHETYTPARGGSAQAEIDALRAAFGPEAREIVVTNTKGFTGHPMGAGIEDGVVLKALQHGRVPPIANLREPDESLGDLTLSRGERRDFRYALRLAAGFGSQLSITVNKAVARGEQRVADTARRAAWLREVTGLASPVERVDQRTLRVTEGEALAATPASGASAAAPPAKPATPPKAVPVQTPLPAVRRPPPIADQPHSLLPTPAPAPERVGPPRTSTAPAPTAAPAVSLDQVLRELTALVADKTGYAPDEIEPDYELEADLGVDTVKQAEILSEVTERFGVTRDESFRVADFPTLRAIAGWIAGRRGAAPTTAAPATPPAVASPPPVPVRPPETGTPVATRERELPAAPTAARAVGAADVLASLTALVAEKSGYDHGELEPGYELEADLGIDTVKQAEILSELTTRYGLPRDEAFRLSDHPTLEKLAAYVAGRTGSAPVAAPPPSAPRPLDQTPVAVPERQEEGLSIDSEPLSTEEPVAGGHAAVLAALMAVVAEKTGYEVSDLEPSFELEADLGVDTVKQAEILSDLTTRLGVTRDEGFRLADAPTLDALARYLHARVTGAAPRGAAADEPEDDPPTIIGARPVRSPDAPTPISVDRIRPVAHTPLPDHFRVRRPTLDLLAARPARDLSGRRFDLLGGGMFADALREALTQRGASPGTGDLFVDLGDDVLASFRRARELDGNRPTAWLCVTRLGAFGDGDLGVRRAFTDGARAGFAKSIGREWSVGYEVLDVHPDVPLSAAAAVVADELARAPVPEVFVDAAGATRRVILVDDLPPEPAVLPDLPVIVLTGGARGITASVARAFARRGPATLILVGRSAVPEEPLDEKAAKERIKADLAARGERTVPARVEQVLEPLRRGEEARRTIVGLRELGAQVTYLQADLADPDDVKRLVRQVTTDFGTPTVVVHGAGVEESRKIADKDESAFHRVFDGKALGGRALVEALPPETFFVSMGSVAGRFGNPGQVDYAAANDAMARVCHARPHSLHVDWTAWDDVGMAVRGGMRTLLGERGVDLLPADAGASLLANLVARGVTGELVVAGRLGDFEERPDHPLLDTLEVSAGVAKASRALSRASDPWILDHAIEGVPVLPGVIGLELMVATARALSPTADWTGARNVRFDAPVKVHRDEITTVFVEAEPGARPGEVQARLVSVRTLKTGRTRRTEHFSATLTFGQRAAPEALPSAFLPDEIVDREGIYRRFFHGPAFRVLSGVLGVSEDGLMAEGRVDHRPIAGARALLTSPLALEAAFQAAGLHRMITTHGMGLPLGIEEVHLLGAPSADDLLTLMVQLDGDVWNVDVDSAKGPVMRIRGFQMIEKGPVPPADRFPVPAEGRPSCFPPSTRPRRPDGGAVTARASEADDARDWLAPDELAELRGRGTERRVADRVAGRIAAKRALSLLTGVPPLGLRIDNDPLGAPVVTGAPAQVSISHRGGHAVAVASSGPIGVDLELVAPRPASFLADWLTDGERARCGDDPLRVNLCWAAKEAVSKCLGTGLRIGAREIEVVAFGDAALEVALTGAARDRAVARGCAELVVTWTQEGDEVVVVARPRDARAA